MHIPSNLEELVMLRIKLATILFMESKELLVFSVPTQPLSLVMDPNLLFSILSASKSRRLINVNATSCGKED